jgi:hypothetical protein
MSLLTRHLRNTVFSFSLLGASLGGFAQDKPKDKPEPKTEFQENADSIRFVADEDLEKYAEETAEKIFASYQENAKQGKHTIVLMGESHNILSHHYVQMAINRRLIEKIGADNFIHTIEQNHEEEGDLETLKTLLRKHSDKSMGEVIEKYAQATSGIGQVFRTLNMAQSLRAGSRVRFIDSSEDTQYESLVNRNEAAELERGGLFDMLNIPPEYRYAPTLLDRHVQHPYGKMVRDGFAYSRISTILTDDIPKEQKEPVILMHSAGRLHLIDDPDLFPPYQNMKAGRPTLAMLLQEQGEWNVIAIPLLVEGKEKDYRGDEKMAPVKLKQLYPTVFSFNVAEMIVPSAQWNKLCEQNGRPEYGLKEELRLRPRRP